MITGIVIALPEELSSLTSTKITKGHCVFIHPQLVVAVAGTGPRNAERAAQQLLAQGANQLISWGCAAALSPALKPGDLTLAAEFLAANGENVVIAKHWQTATKQLLARQLNVHSGSLLESEQIVATAQEKAALHQRTQAIALDMESIAVARVAAQQQLPFLAVRAIADPVSMTLPGAISYAMNAEGEVQISKLLRYLMLHPFEISQLLKLGLHFHAALKTLKCVANSLDDIAALTLTPYPA